MDNEYEVLWVSEETAQRLGFAFLPNVKGGNWMKIAAPEGAFQFDENDRVIAIEIQ